MSLVALAILGGVLDQDFKTLLAWLNPNGSDYIHLKEKKKTILLFAWSVSK